jgi:hypothetical protein
LIHTAPFDGVCFFTMIHPIRHFLTITRHRMLVCKFCFRAGLIRQGLLHDLSKYSPTEFWVGCKYYQGVRSPNNEEREKTGISRAWLHHKGRNKHHFEYWIDYSTNRSDPHILTGCRMPRKYVAEMILDRVSASMIYRGKAFSLRDPLDYFEKSKDFAWYIHPETLKEMDLLLHMWAEEGEENTIRYIREVFLKGED